MVWIFDVLSIIKPFLSKQWLKAGQGEKAEKNWLALPRPK